MMCDFLKIRLNNLRIKKNIWGEDLCLIMMYKIKTKRVKNGGGQKRRKIMSKICIANAYVKREIDYFSKPQQNILLGHVLKW